MAKEIAFRIEVDNAELQQLLKEIGALVTQYHQAGKAQQETTKTQKSLNDGFKAMRQGIAQTGNSLKTLRGAIGQLGLDKSTAQTEQMAAAQQTLKAATQAGSEAFDTYANSIANASMQLEGMGERATSVAQAQEVGMALGQVVTSLETIEQISEVRLQNELGRINEKRQAEIEAVNDSVLTEEQKRDQIESINAKYDKQAEAKKKAAAKREKAFAITKTIIAGAQAVAQGIAQFGPPPSPAGIAAIAAAAVTTATQLALIAKQKFAKGGVIPFQSGGMIQGAAHAQGGVPFLSNGNMMEAEGGELIVNRKIWSRPDFVKTISDMNAITGGKRFFASGGVVPTVSPPSYVATHGLPSEGFDSDSLIKGLRGVIADEVGSLKIVNNVVDTTSQQQRLLNIQSEASF